MNFIRTRLLPAALGIAATLLMAGGAQAGLITYEITADTSSLTGQTGYLDFQFNGGNIPVDAGTATLTGFATDGTLSAGPADLGDVSGDLPGTVTIANTAAVNDYTPAITFGSFFDVFVTLDIPTISGTAASGNTFSLDVEDLGFNSLLGAFPALQIDLDQDTGAATVTNNSNGAITASQTPEPSAFVLFGIGLAAVALFGRPAIFFMNY